MSLFAPPMEPMPWPEAFDDPLWQFEVKWDGVRCRAEVGQGRVRLLSRTGREWTDRFPDLARGLSAYAGVFDGEICVLRDGRPDFPSVLRRLAQSSGPAYLVVFDCLETGRGEDIRAQPLEMRQSRIPAFPEGPVQRISPVLGAGRNLFAAVRASELEGIVCKRLGSPYRSGRSADWRKVKCWRTLVATAGRAQVHAGEVRSLELLGDAGETIGRVGPLPPAISRELIARLSDSAPVRCQIRYLEWTDGGRVRQPVWMGFAGD